MTVQFFPPVCTGAGKTTLLNAILRNKQGLRVAVFVNGPMPQNISECAHETNRPWHRAEFGAVDVDGEILMRSEVDDADIVTLDNGCICCTINASLRKLHPTEAERVVTDLLGAGGSVHEFDLSGAGLKGTWAAIFGEAPVSSAVLCTVSEP